MMIRQERIVVETSLKTCTVTIVTVGEVTGNYISGDGSFGGFCHKRPLAVALATRKGVRAFDTDGKEMEVPDFLERFPDTKPLLEKRLRIRREQ